MLTKHNSKFAVYSSWVGREHLHTLVEECSTLKEALEKSVKYINKSTITYVVGKGGSIIWKDK